MTDDMIFTSAGILALTEDEQKILSSLLDGHDRGAFYMAYNAMTDSSEASLQSRISTFSGSVGGAALSANRLAQTQIGPGTQVGTYPGMYVLSQEIAESALLSALRPIGIKANLPVNAGVINDAEFFNTAKDAWIARGVHPYFPGNLIDGLLNSASTIGGAFVNAFNIQWGALEETEKNAQALAEKSKIAFEQVSNLFQPGAANSLFASLVYDRFGKTNSGMLAAGYHAVQGPNGHTIYIDGNGHVGATLKADFNDLLLPIAGGALRTLLNANLGFLIGSLLTNGQTFADYVADMIADIVQPQSFGPIVPANFTEFHGFFNGDTQDPLNIGQVEPHAVWSVSATDLANILETESGSLDGGKGNDVLFGGAGANELSGGEGNDTIWGRVGSDQLFGGKGNDTLRGGSGDDVLTGNEGDDLLDGGDINLSREQDGQDQAIYNLSPKAVKLLVGGSEYDIKNRLIRAIDDGFGGKDILHSIENIVLTEFDDIVEFAAFPEQDFNVRIRGGLGEDTIDFTKYGKVVDPTTLKLRLLNGVSAATVGGMLLDNFEIVKDNEKSSSIYGLIGDETGELTIAEMIALIRDSAQSVKTAELAFKVLMGFDYKSLGSVHTVYGGEGNDFIAASTGAVELKGEAGNDLLIANHAIYTPPVEATETTPAKPAKYLTINGGDGNDWIAVRDGIGAITIGGAGRDWIFNRTKGGELYGDTFSGQPEGAGAINGPSQPEVTFAVLVVAKHHDHGCQEE
jgi:Ca2+-binding RTX toxin-like protein